jgi:iron complex transport system substrate-binding protein
VVAGPGSFVDELLRDAGGTNAAASAKTPYAVYSAESAIRAKPDVVIDAVMGHEAGGDKLKALPGLKEARWVTVPSEDLLHPGPNIARGLKALFEMIHGAPK